MAQKARTEEELAKLKHDDAQLAARLKPWHTLLEQTSHEHRREMMRRRLQK